MNDTERQQKITGQITQTYEDPFVPDIGPPSHPMPADKRQARAMEYIAYQMYFIRRALENQPL